MHPWETETGKTTTSLHLIRRCRIDGDNQSGAVFSHLPGSADRGTSSARPWTAIPSQRGFKLITHSV